MLFDRPLHRDPLLILFGAVVLVAAVVSAVHNIDPGTEYSPERAGNIAGTVVTAALFGFFLLAWLPAVVRRDYRADKERDARAAGEAGLPGGGGAGSGGGVLGTGSKLLHRERGWTSAAPRRMDIGTPTDEAGNPYLAPGLSLSVSTRRTIPEVPVELTWKADHADSVRISELPGTYPASGSVDVYLASTRDIIVTATNRGGHVEKRTHVIQVLPTPTLEVIRTPAPPAVSLRASVDVGLNWSQEQVLTRLDAVLDEQERRRVARAPELPDELRLQDVLASLRDRASTLAGWRPLGFPQAPVEPLNSTLRSRVSSVVGPHMTAVLGPLRNRVGTRRDRPAVARTSEPAPVVATQVDEAPVARGHVSVRPQPSPVHLVQTAAAPAAPVAPSRPGVPSRPAGPPPSPVHLPRDARWGTPSPAGPSLSSPSQDRSAR